MLEKIIATLLITSMLLIFTSFLVPKDSERLFVKAAVASLGLVVIVILLSIWI